jgi:hypothetical protein
MQLLIFYLICGALAYYILWEFLLNVYYVYLKYTTKDKNPFYVYWFSVLLGVIVLSVVLHRYNNRDYQPMIIELNSGEVVRGFFRINVYNNYETSYGKEYFKGAIKTIANDKYISMFKDTDMLLDDIFNNIDTTQKIHTEKKK